MVIAEMEIKVSVEQAIHNAMKEFAIKYYQDYGVMVDSIHFDWTYSDFRLLETKGKSIIKTTINTSAHG